MVIIFMTDDVNDNGVCDCCCCFVDCGVAAGTERLLFIRQLYTGMYLASRSSLEKEQ